MATNIRSVLEVMKFLEPSTLLHQAWQVSKQWCEAVDNHEVWCSILSDSYEDEVIVEAKLYQPGRTAYKWFHETRTSIYTFNDGDRFLDKIRKQEAEKKEEEFKRQPTFLLHVQLPSKEKSSVALLETYRHAFHASFVWLPPSHLFITGGRFEDFMEDYSPTYLLFLHDVSVKVLEQTPQINSPTLIYYNRFVYSFGGSIFPPGSPAVSQVTARKFSMNALTWEPLGDGEMPNPHCYGWGERHNTKIFIIGGFGSQGSIDEFDTITEAFRTLTIKLPMGTTAKHEALYAIRKDNSLICLTGQKTFTLGLHELATDGASVGAEEQLSMDNVWMWNSPSVVTKDTAFFVIFDTVLYQMDLASKKFEQNNLVGEVAS